MPTVLRVHGYRFFFYSNEGSEPPHVHVERAEFTAKFWLRPVESASSTRFSGPELRRLHRIVELRRDRIEEAWHEYFGE
ncbi:DUF4160 domain-containing protein [Microbacterium sp. SA39]|uniref:DUF4160 domain-containing protein n=1 Tax=Microbacterium sp. SA39 TaxID=1263625 RepID=UPI0005FA3B49|nr:DUF4160 domain-containing protein [Microbacterium sp. SA39]